MPNTKRSSSSYYVRKRLKVTYSVALWYRSGLYRKSHRRYLPRPPAGKTNLSEVMKALENADDVSSRKKGLHTASCIFEGSVFLLCVEYSSGETQSNDSYRAKLELESSKNRRSLFTLSGNNPMPGLEKL
jgi:hypothetical protein